MRAIAILTYHSLDESGSVVSVAPGIFAAQMAGLAEAGWRAISLRQALEQRDRSGDWPRNAVVVTFDDGFANLHEQGLPVLVRYGFGATVFVIVEHLDGINDWGPPVRRLGRQTMLSWHQVKDLADNGIEIGAHTLSHADLSDPESETLEQEIVGSAQELEARLRKPVQTFAYPWGRVSDQAVAIVGRTFRAACTTVHRRASDEPLTRLPRVDMYYFRNCRDLRPLMSGQLDHVLTLRRWARRVRRSLPCRASDGAAVTAPGSNSRTDARETPR